MKTRITLGGLGKCILAITLALSLATPAIAKSDASHKERGGSDHTFMSRKEKLKLIDAQINDLNAEKKTGWWIIGGGTAALLLSYAFVPGAVSDYTTGTVTPTGNTAIYELLVVGGGVVALWGVYTVWDASSQLGSLEAKKYDLSFNPFVSPDRGTIFTGLAVTMKFGS